MRNCHWHLAYGAVLTSFYISPVLAQTVDDQKVEVVLVTAQKRQQRLQDVPMSISVISDEVLAAERAVSVESLAGFIPSFHAAGVTAHQPQFTIRGIGTNDRQAGSDPSVAVFVDEQYIGRPSASTFSLLDVNRVEVLRGPQGTLFGRNVSGGAISVVTNKPDPSAFAGWANVGGGNISLREIQGYVNVPLNKTSAFRLAATDRSRNGYYNNIFLNQRAGDTRSQAARGQFSFEPAPRFKGLVAIEASEDNVNGLGTKLIRGQDVSDAAYATAVGSFNLANNPYIFPSSRDFDVANNVLGNSNSKGLAVRGNLEWTGDTVSATFLVGARKSSLSELADTVGIPLIGSGATTRGYSSAQSTSDDYKANNAELRLQSLSKDSSVQWLVGTNFLHEVVTRDLLITRQPNNAFSAPEFLQSVKPNSSAIFGDLSWRFAPGFALTVGDRYTVDRKEFDVAVTNTLTAAQQAAIRANLGVAPTLNPAVAPFTAATAQKFQKSTPRVSLQYEPVRQVSLYAIWSTGYKTGGFNGTPANVAAAITGFRPETVENREIGMKSRLMDGRMVLNLSAFDMSFRDFQISDRFFLVPGDASTLVNQVTNAAQAKIHGIEGDMRLKPIKGLTLAGSFGLLNTKITEVNAGSTLLVGSPLPRAPHTSFNLSAEYSRPGSDGGVMNYRIGYHRHGETYLAANSGAAGKQGAYGLVAASIAFEVRDWTVSLWGKNLSDTHYLTVANLFPNGAAGPVQYGEPRTFGVSVAKQF